MKTLIAMIGAAAFLAACNDAPAQHAGPPKAAAAAADLTAVDQFELRLLAVNFGQVGEALLAIRELRVEGAPGASITPVDSTLTLVPSDHAWLLGRLSVPCDAEEVRIVVVLDDFGGLEATGGNESVRARGAEIAFTAPVAWLRLNGHAVIHLDVAASLDAYRGGDRLLLPVAAVHY